MSLPIEDRPAQRPEPAQAGTSAEELDQMLRHPSTLPDLPDLDTMLVTAERRRDHFSEVAKIAQAEADKAQDIIQRLTGRTRTKGRQKPKEQSVSESFYLSVLGALGRHRYGRISTVASGASASASQTGYALKLGLKRGHVTREKRGRAHRYYITESGVDYLTAPDAQT